MRSVKHSPELTFPGTNLSFLCRLLTLKQKRQRAMHQKSVQKREEGPLVRQ